MVWTVWVFVLPNLAIGFTRNLIPKESPYLLDRRVLELRREADQKVRAELDAFWDRQRIQDWNSLSRDEQQRFINASNKIRAASLEVHDEPYQAALATFRRDRHNRTQRRVNLVTTLSAISPAASLNVIAMDLARTGFHQQMRIEEALSLHQVYLAKYIRQKQGQQEPALNDFVPFAYKDSEKLSAVWGRNLMYVLNLALLTVLGFAGAYVAILRYDVR